MPINIADIMGWYDDPTLGYEMPKHIIGDDLINGGSVAFDGRRNLSLGRGNTASDEGTGD